MPSIDDIVSDFEFLDDWEDRYRYLIELGRSLPEMSEEEMNEASKVRGCVSQVWLVSATDDASPPHVTFRGQSDAHIVRGLVAVALALLVLVGISWGVWWRRIFSTPTPRLSLRASALQTI